VPTTVIVRGNVLQINAMGNGWTLGEKHNLLIRAVGLEAAGSTATNSFTGFVFGGDPAMPRSPMAATFVARRAMANMGPTIQNGDSLTITLDAPLKPGTSAAFFQYNFDINQMNGTMDFGEFGTMGGFTFNADEPTLDPMTSQFGCKPSGSTKRYRAIVSGLPLNGVPVGTQMRAVFSTIGAGQNGWQTLWGQPFTQNLTGSVSIVP
jgi:hypothetical protein